MGQYIVCLHRPVVQCAMHTCTRFVYGFYGSPDVWNGGITEHWANTGACSPGIIWAFQLAPIYATARNGTQRRATAHDGIQCMPHTYRYRDATPQTVRFRSSALYTWTNDRPFSSLIPRPMYLYP